MPTSYVNHTHQETLSSGVVSIVYFNNPITVLRVKTLFGGYVNVRPDPMGTADPTDKGDDTLYVWGDEVLPYMGPINSVKLLGQTGQTPTVFLEGLD